MLYLLYLRASGYVVVHINSANSLLMRIQLQLLLLEYKLKLNDKIILSVSFILSFSILRIVMVNTNVVGIEWYHRVVVEIVEHQSVVKSCERTGISTDPDMKLTFKRGRYLATMLCPSSKMVEMKHKMECVTRIVLFFSFSFSLSNGEVLIC